MFNGVRFSHADRHGEWSVLIYLADTDRAFWVDFDYSGDGQVHINEDLPF